MEQAVKKLFLALTLLVLAMPLFAEHEFGFRLMPVFTAPAGVKNFGPGFGADASLDWGFLSMGKFGAGLTAGGGFSSLAISDGSAFTLFEGGAGPFFRWRLMDRLTLRGDFSAGVYRYQWGDDSNSRVKVGGGFSADVHLSPSVSLFASGGYRWYAFSADRPIHAVTAGIGIGLNLSELLKPQTRVTGEKTEQRRVFPVSYAWYEDNPVAVVAVTNNEPNAITGISLSFFMERYMSQPSVFAVLPRLLPGETAELPVTALFNESMLDLTENLNANALVSIDYRTLGAKKQAAFPVQMPVYHRNAFVWDDDRRAAAFVSERDPAAVLFARYVRSVVRDMKEESPALFFGMPENIQYALGLFEALRLYGINYIIDPASSYLEMSESASSLDSLNYPYQTLFYRGGDCDDLSILFCSMLEVLGIDTAFITIPGHIYCALDISEQRTINREQSTVNSEQWVAANRDMLIEHGGRFWIPVEMTISGEGFTQAVRVGVREWRRVNDEGTIYPMKESWERYPAVSVPNASGHMPDLPDENELVRAIEREMGKFNH